MKINFAPNNYHPSTGPISFLTWTNRDLQEAIRQAFCESPREEIVELIVEYDGIKAVFETKA